MLEHLAPCPGESTGHPFGVLGSVPAVKQVQAQTGRSGPGMGIWMWHNCQIQAPTTPQAHRNLPCPVLPPSHFPPPRKAPLPAELDCQHWPSTTCALAKVPYGTFTAVLNSHSGHVSAQQAVRIALPGFTFTSYYSFGGCFIFQNAQY